MIKSWRDLEVWQKAHKLALKIYKVTAAFPSEEKYRLVDQLCRAAISIPNNIAEGKGRSSLKEYIQFLYIAKGSVEELQYLILLSKDLNYFKEIDYKVFESDCEEIGKMLSGLIKSLRSKT